MSAPDRTEYLHKNLASIGEAGTRPEVDEENGTTAPGLPLNTVPEPKEGTLEAAILGLRRASRDESGIPEDW